MGRQRESNVRTSWKLLTFCQTLLLGVSMTLTFGDITRDYLLPLLWWKSRQLWPLTTLLPFHCVMYFLIIMPAIGMRYLWRVVISEEETHNNVCVEKVLVGLLVKTFVILLEGQGRTARRVSTTVYSKSGLLFSPKTWTAGLFSLYGINRIRPGIRLYYDPPQYIRLNTILSRAFI